MAISKEKLIKYLEEQNHICISSHKEITNDISEAFYHGYDYALEEIQNLLSDGYFEEDPPAEETDNCFFCGCSSCNNECLDSDSDDY